MKLEEFMSKLKQSKMKIIDFQHTDMDRVGDLMLAAALAAAISGFAITYYYASKMNDIVFTAF